MSPTPPPAPDDLQKTIALELLLDAWETALSRGVSPELLASTAIFAALADMIDMHGESAVADFCAALPARIRNGEFTMRET